MSKGFSFNRRFFFPFDTAKMEMTDDGCLILSGILTAEVEDGDGEVMDYESVKACLEEFKKWNNLREMHGRSAVGLFTDYFCDDAAKLIRVVCKVVDPLAIRKCMEGVYKGFSIGARIVKKIGKRLFAGRINEGSLVDRPSVPIALFDTGKSLEFDIETRSVDAMKKWSGKVVEKSLGMISMANELLQGIANLARWIAREEADESAETPGVAGHGAALVAEGQNAVNVFGQFLLNLANAEVGELLTTSGVEDELAEGATPPAPGTAEQMLTAGKDDVEKVGAKFSGSTKKALGDLHSHAKELVAKVGGMLGLKEECAKCKAMGEHHKALGELMAAHKAALPEETMKALTELHGKMGETMKEEAEAAPANGDDPKKHPAADAPAKDDKPAAGDKKTDGEKKPEADKEEAKKCDKCGKALPSDGKCDCQKEQAHPGGTTVADAGRDREKVLEAENAALKERLAKIPAPDANRTKVGEDGTIIVEKGIGPDQAPGAKPEQKWYERDAVKGMIEQVRKLPAGSDARNTLRMKMLHDVQDAGFDPAIVEKLLAGEPVN